MAYDYNDASNHNISFGDVTFLDGLSTISGHIWVNLDDTAADHYLFAKYDGTNGFLFLFDNVGSTSGRTNIFTIYTYNSLTAAKVESATNSATSGSWQSVAFTWQANSSTGLRIYIDGVEDANSPVTTIGQSTFPNMAGVLRIGSTSAGGGYMDGQIGGCSLWDTVLTAEDVAALTNYRDPREVKAQNLLWSPEFIRGAQDPITGASGTISGATVTPHHPLNRRIFAQPMIALTSAGTTVSVPASSLSLIGYAPTVTATDNQTIDIPLASLALVGNAPTVIATGNITIDIPVASLALVGQAPTVNATANVSIDIPSASLTLTGQAPIIVAGGNIVIDVPVASLSLIGYGPTVLNPQTIDIPAAVLTLDGLAPTIENVVTVNIPVGSLTLEGEIPTISATANIAINIPVGSLGLTGYAPTVIALGVVPSAPGLEYTLPVNLLHFVIPEGKLHATLLENRLHYTMKEED